MATRALVLGGGGVIGVAWETGLLAGLQEHGVDLTTADLIVGTSAGSIVGTQVAGGRSLAELYARNRQPGDPRLGGAPLGNDPLTLARIAAPWAASHTSRTGRAHIGRLALTARTVPEVERLRLLESRLDVADWPERRLSLTAVDALDGSFKVWDRAAGVPMLQAVASSCAVPGLFPPVTIGERRYIDGGVRSATNADLARGNAIVVIVAPIGVSLRGIGGLGGLTLRGEVRQLRIDGSRVEQILPDPAALLAFGPNLMDAEHRAAAAEAGHRQGVALARRLRPVWNG